MLKFSRRELRGLGILAIGGMIKRIRENMFAVKSERTDDWYTVEWKDGKWICSCPDYAKRKKPCKHIYAVNFLLDLPMIMLSNSEAFTRICPKCGSANTGPKGFRYNMSGAVRIWRCKDCGKRFKDPLASESAGAKAALMIIALDLYFKGLSLRNISDHLWQVYGIKKSASTLSRWINQMTKKLNQVLSDVHVEVGDKWLADETVVKVAGKAMYLWNVMDYETRHYIVSVLSKRRSSEEALKVIKQAISQAGKIPKQVVTDGLKAYSKALRQLEKLPIEHISNVGLAKKENNNRIERLHGTIKDWIGRRRNLKNIENAKNLLEGYRAYYNMTRPNTAISKNRRKLATLLLNANN